MGAVEVAVSAAVVDAAAEVVEVVDAEAATTVTKMATLLENVLRDVTMEATTTVIRHEKKSSRDSIDQKQPKKSRKKTKPESPRSFPVNPGLSCAVYLQLSLNVSNAL